MSEREEYNSMIEEDSTQSSFSILDSDLDEDVCWDRENVNTDGIALLIGQQSDTGVDTSASSTLSTATIDQPRASSCTNGGGLTRERGTVRKSRDRKTAKQQTERKRRDRINALLDTLRKLILQLLHKNPRHHRKLEKADILELVVSFLKRELGQKQRKKKSNSNQTPPPSSSSSIEQTDRLLQHVNILPDNQRIHVPMSPSFINPDATVSNPPPSMNASAIPYPIPVHYNTQTPLPDKHISDPIDRRPPLGNVDLNNNQFYHFPTLIPTVSQPSHYDMSHWIPCSVSCAAGMPTAPSAFPFAVMNGPIQYNTNTSMYSRPPNMTLNEENQTFMPHLTSMCPTKRDASLWRPYI